MNERVNLLNELNECELTVLEFALGNLYVRNERNRRRTKNPEKLGFQTKLNESLLSCISKLGLNERMRDIL